MERRQHLLNSSAVPAILRDALLSFQVAVLPINYRLMENVLKQAAYRLLRDHCQIPAHGPNRHQILLLPAIITHKGYYMAINLASIWNPERSFTQHNRDLYPCPEKLYNLNNNEKI